MLHPYPGYCGTARIESTEVPDAGMKVLQKKQKLQVLWHGRTELTEIPGTGVSVLRRMLR